MSRIGAIWLASLIGGRAVDLVMSIGAFALGAAEANPAARLAWEHGGIWAMLALETGGVALIIGIVRWLPVWKRLGMVATGIGSWVPVLLNVALMFGLWRPL